jgi:hydrogenase maturation protease
MGGNKMSLHQVGMNDILASLDLLGYTPAHLTVVGIKPVELADYGGSLTAEVQSKVPAAVQLGIDELRRWGVEVRERADGAERDVVIHAVRQGEYESGRPSPEVAYRRGDPRFLRREAEDAAGPGQTGGKSE